MSSKVLQPSPALPVQDGAPAAMAVLRLAGPDAARFLQGQVTQDISALPAGHWTRAALCTAQGRVLALPKVVAVPEGLWLVLPAERVAAVRAHLQRFVLRAKVKLETEAVPGVTPCAGPGSGFRALEGPFLPVTGGEGGFALSLSPGRQLWLTETSAPPPSPALGWPEWLAACVADGEPEVFDASAEQWTPHMLGQDQWQAISLTKGCYTGQEIVARTHYLGKNKRRLERVGLAAGKLPLPGAALDLPDGRRAEWVLGTGDDDGAEGLVVTASP